MTLTDTDSALLASAASAAAEQIAEALGLAVEIGDVHDGSDTQALLVPGPGAHAVAAGLSASGHSAITGWLVLALAAEVVDSIEPDDDGNPPDLVDAVRPALLEGVSALEPAFGPQTLDQAEATDAESLLSATVAERAPHQLLAIVPLLADGQHVATVAVAVDRQEPPPLELPVLGASAPNTAALPARTLSSLNGVEMAVTVELGRTRLSVKDLLELHPGAVVQLDRAASSPVDIFVNGTLIAKGEVVVVDDDFGVRITDLVDRQS